MTKPISAPTLALDVDGRVDWLELTALFDTYGIARLDTLLGSLAELEETAENNIGTRDQKREQDIEELENEIAHRQRQLGQAYPFNLSESAEELCLVGDWKDQKYAFYIICLITAHVTGSLILRRPPEGNLLIRLRNQIFQIVATLGLAGLSRGPGFSIGWPRENKETIVEILTRASAAGGGFKVRIPPGLYVPPQEKDGGIDVMAWTDEGSPPPSALFFGQTASGKNWIDKPIAEHARVFIANYMLDVATGNLNHVTLTPFRILDDTEWYASHQNHRAILERTRLPRRALEGLELAGKGVSIDGANSLDKLSEWLEDFIGHAQAA